VTPEQIEEINVKVRALTTELQGANAKIAFLVGQFNEDDEATGLLGDGQNSIEADKKRTDALSKYVLNEKFLRVHRH
jgi:hypothetical protein